MKRILSSLLFGITISFSLSAQWNLEKCLEFAKDNNKELLARKEQISVSGYEKNIALSTFLPEINLHMESDYFWKIPVENFPGEIFGLPSERITVATGTKHSGSYGIHVNWKLIDVQEWQKIKMEKLKGQSLEYGYESFQRLLLRNITASYYNVQFQKQNIELANRLLDYYSQIHTILLQQFDEGILDKISINQSTAILSDYRKYQSEQELSYQKSMLELKYWMGFPPDEYLDISYTNYIHVPELNSVGFNTGLLPGYKEKKALLEMTNHKLKSSKSYMLPRLSLVSSFGRTGFGNNPGEFGKSTSWHSNGFVGFRLNIPIFSARSINTVKRNNAIHRQASIEFEAYQARETKKFLQLKLDLEKSISDLSAQEEIRKLAEENLFLCHKKIEQGIIDIIQLKQVQQDLIRSIEFENHIQIEYIKNQIELKYLQNEIN